MKILLVDDEVGVLRVLTRLFVRYGHEVRTASSGEAALEVLDKFAPDAVVSDYKMSGMTGGALLGLVARRMPHVRRVLLSGYAEAHGVIDATFIAKPYRAEELLRACE